MLVKRTRDNQITIPEEIMRQAKLKESDEYFDVVCENGVIKLRPVDIQERLPPQAYEALLDSAFKHEHGDKATSSSDAVSVLSKRSKKQ